MWSLPQLKPQAAWTKTKARATSLGSWKLPKEESSLAPKEVWSNRGEPAYDSRISRSTQQHRSANRQLQFQIKIPSLWNTNVDSLVICGILVQRSADGQRMASHCKHTCCRTQRHRRHPHHLGGSALQCHPHGSEWCYRRGSSHWLSRRLPHEFGFWLSYLAIFSRDVLALVLPSSRSIFS